jgi:hypothetical protein
MLSKMRADFAVRAARKPNYDREIFNRASSSRTVEAAADIRESKTKKRLQARKARRT